MSRRPEDTAGAAGRSVGLRPAPPALAGQRGGCFPRDPPLPASVALGLVPAAGLERREAAAGVPGGAVVQLPRARGVSTLGVPLAVRRGWDGGSGGW